MTEERRPTRQLPLSLPHRAEMTRADFVTGAANERAAALVDRWPDWPERGAFLTGPAGSGKSHLVAIWTAASHAARIVAAELSVDRVEALLSHGAVAVEDLHAGPVDEPALFHLLNRAHERRVSVLATSRVQAAGLVIALADLRSRLRAMQPVELAEPDDDLLRRVLAKLFADRQLAVDPAVIDYIVLRIERSLAAAAAVVAELDREALAEGRGVTRPLAGSVLRRFDQQIDFWPDDSPTRVQ